MKELAVSATLSYDSSGTRAANKSFKFNLPSVAGLRMCEAHDLGIIVLPIPSGGSPWRCGSDAFGVT